MGHSDTTPTGEISARPVPPLACDAAGIWDVIRGEAAVEAGASPFAREVLAEAVLRHPTLQAGLAALLAERLHARGDEAVRLEAVLAEAFSGRDETGGIGPLRGACLDLAAAVKRDRAHPCLLYVFLFYKGYLALQGHRCAHRLWGQGRRLEALWLPAMSSEAFGVDIHPRASFGAGIVIDHATGVVVGETAVVEDDVTLFHDVTLGATGKHDGDRHPKNPARSARRRRRADTRQCRDRARRSRRCGQRGGRRRAGIRDRRRRPRTRRRTPRPPHDFGDAARGGAPARVAATTRPGGTRQGVAPVSDPAPVPRRPDRARARMKGPTCKHAGLSRCS